MQPRILAALVLLGGVALSAEAAAYTTRKTDAGLPVRWRTAKVEVIADPSLTAIAPSAIEVAERALATWQSVPGAQPPLVVVREGAADAIGYVKGAANHSTIRYAPEGADIAGGALGVTVVTFDDRGTVLDADIVINGGPTRGFAILPDVAGPSSVATSANTDYDLQNVLTHEAGHFFGLEHETHLDSAMFPSSARGEIKKRTLTADDAAGLVAIYSASDPMTIGGCSASSPSSPASTGAVAVVALALGALAARSRRLRGAAAVIAIGLAGASAFGALTPAPASAGSSFVTVTVAESRWEGGLLVTTIDFVTSNGDTARVEVDGGHDAGLTQIVGDREAPRAGDRLSARAVDGALIVDALPNLHRSRNAR